MAQPNFAATRRVNPPEAQLKLSASQVWKGLMIKARQPALFIPSVTACTLVKDTELSVTRQVSFAGGLSMTEEITIYPNTILYFDAEEKGIHITNILSYDEHNELNLTFSFAGGIPGFPPSATPPPPQELNKTIGKGVEITLQKIRELVQDGTITED